jgi:hypothetical protein
MEREALADKLLECLALGRDSVFEPGGAGPALANNPKRHR